MREAILLAAKLARWKKEGGEGMNPSIFREYDIRGLAEKDFDAGFARLLGKVHGTIVAENGGRRVGIEPEVTFTGGVSRNIGMVRALEEKLGMKLNVSPDSHFVGALGASIFALERATTQAGARDEEQARAAT